MEEKKERKQRSGKGQSYIYDNEPTLKQVNINISREQYRFLKSQSSTISSYLRGLIEKDMVNNEKDN